MIKLNNLRNQERDTMRTALTVLSSLAATRAELIEAEQERCSEVIADAVKQEDAADEVHQLLEQACAARGINTAGPTKELVARLAESGASMRGLLEADLTQARAELEAERARHEATRASVEHARHVENKAELQRVRGELDHVRHRLECACKEHSLSTDGQAIDLLVRVFEHSRGLMRNTDYLDEAGPGELAECPNGGGNQ